MKKKKSKRGKRNLVATRGELAKALGKNPITMSRWADQGCPCSIEDKHRDGGYDVDAVREWAIAAGKITEEGMAIGPRKARDPQKITTAHVYREAQAGERAAKARIAELNARRLEGELVSKIDVEAHDRKRHEYMIGVLENWARSLGPLLAGKTAVEISRVMIAKVQEVMDEFAGLNET